MLSEKDGEKLIFVSVIIIVLNEDRLEEGAKVASYIPFQTISAIIPQKPVICTQSVPDSIPSLGNKRFSIGR